MVSYARFEHYLTTLEVETRPEFWPPAPVSGPLSGAAVQQRGGHLHGPAFKWSYRGNTAMKFVALVAERCPLPHAAPCALTCFKLEFGWFNLSPRPGCFHILCPSLSFWQSHPQVPSWSETRRLVWNHPTSTRLPARWAPLASSPSSPPLHSVVNH